MMNGGFAEGRTSNVGRIGAFAAGLGSVIQRQSTYHQVIDNQAGLSAASRTIDPMMYKDAPR
jgi:hypothetical protein